MTALATFIQQLSAALPDDRIMTDAGSTWAYGMDNSRVHHAADVVVFPESHDEVVEIMRLAAEHRLPVTTRGRGTGTAGGSVPVEGGVVLVTDRMTRVLDFRPEDRLIVVEAGLINAELQGLVAEKGFFWPPDPTSNALCTVGGNLGCNAAGPHAVKYGTTRENVLGLRAVDGRGQTIKAGSQTTKGVVGHDLTRLMIGSEGTLGVITEATLKLTPLPETRRLLRAFYPDMHAASEAVSRVMAQPATPAAIEFIDGNALNLLRRNSQATIPDAAGAMLMIEIDGDETGIGGLVERVLAAAQGEGADIAVAETTEEQKALWAARKALSPTLRQVAPKKINEDVVVPVSRIPRLIETLDAIAERHAITIVSFGHAGNGNIHVNLLVDPDDPAQMTGAEQALDEVFSAVLALDGTLSGEHGIGYVKRGFIDREIPPESLALMRGIKSVFDPLGILNPHKKLPDPPAANPPH
ncbi:MULTISPECIES: FAD-linked oxidase C-terminal domain-containing protein [unclassified Guyparkeria]|uniref:FAD-binding oxidoreductase n=1 Tax=unclassified Guyparkeria TaxID=2626246 RepID=UPI0007338611|nr:MULTISPECIES: FAD-linked oxidase C-terminal domain-containing protein [unclassified Guyparkeria]KTG16431.1 dimethylmenaquinone methyltransferase [Guyparkeria sp. XI15]OAE85371.1 dimethylmenaquinone methyltransferase [Guyparkeria sp. WRN-7]